MIDWLKMICCDWRIIQKFIVFEIVDLKRRVSMLTGELDDYYLEGERSGFKFKIKSQNYMEVTGSIHKYYEEGVNNTDFTLTMLSKAIQKFECEFGLPALSLKIVNMEFGVNICTHISPQAILNDIICYKNTLPSEDKRKSNNGRFITYMMSDYITKIYDKGQQYFSNKNQLRIEFKAIKSRVFTELGISTLKDLNHKSSLILLKEKFMCLYQGFAFDDTTIIPTILKTADRKVYDRLRNPKEWSNVKGEKRNTHREREKRFKEVINRYGEYQHYDTLKDLIESKFHQLLHDETLAVFTP